MRVAFVVAVFMQGWARSDFAALIDSREGFDVKTPWPCRVFVVRSLRFCVRLLAAGR